MIALIGNRPAIQVGRHQILEYDTCWLGRALERAAVAAGREDFPFLDEIRKGVEEYLESKCALELLPLDSLFDRIRKMLEKIGCGTIAIALEPLAPPVTFSLEDPARSAGNGFELAFFEILRLELLDLREAGAEEIRFTHLREATLLIRGSDGWDGGCDRLMNEIRVFLWNQNRDLRRERPRPLSLHIEGERIG